MVGTRAHYGESAISSSEHDVLKKISPYKDPFDEIHYETLDVQTFDPKRELSVYSRNDGMNEMKSIKILDAFSSDRNGTRRATESLQAHHDLLSYYSQPKPETIDELYNKTLPEMRSKLKRKNLKQTGILTPVSEDEFQTQKYRNKKDHHDPFHPQAIVDPTLEIFRPKQIVGAKPIEAPDDSLINSIKEMNVDLSIPSRRRGEVIQYLMNIKTRSNDHLDLVIGFVMSHTASSRVICYSERTIRVAGRNDHVVEGNFGVETASLATGTYKVICRLYVFHDQSKDLLSTIGPIEFDVLA